MDSLTDLILRYCVIFGKRFFPKEKITFLRVFSKDVMQFGYQLDAKLAKLKLAKRKYQNYYNGYIGDLNGADLVICTYYDTGIKSFNLIKKYAFHCEFSNQNYLLRLLPIVGIFIVSLILNGLFFIPEIKENGFLSFSGLFLLLTTLILFYFLIRYQSGIPNQKNFINNSSSLVLIINLIKKMNKKNKKKIAFVLLDGGCTNSFGLRMLENYSEKILTKKIIFLDSIGNDDEIQFFKPGNSNLSLNGVDFHEMEIDTKFENYLLITSGKLDDHNRVKIKNANTQKDNFLDVAIIEKHTKMLLDLCCKNIVE